MKRIFLYVTALLLCASCVNLPKVGEGIMHVYSVENPDEEAFLRKECNELSDRELKSKKYRELTQKMIETVTDPSQDGVGIAGPQVGVGKRLIVVCRLDKEGEPFVAYANPQIDSTFGGIVDGREGCLSIPGKYGEVPRYQGIIVSYTNPETLERDREVVTDYTARIFQHEIDHTNGILYTDRTDKIWDEQ